MNKLSNSTTLQKASPQIKSILASYTPPHYFPILSTKQLSNIEKKQKAQKSNREHDQQHPQQKAAILIPIIDIISNCSNSDCDRNTGKSRRTNESIPSILFTKRSKSLAQHANEISFPGGHYDPSLDGNSLTRTAIREAQEELSFPSHSLSISSPKLFLPNENKPNKNGGFYDWENGVEVVGQTSSVPSARGIPVTPIIALFQFAFSKKNKTETGGEDSNNDSLNKIFPGNPDEVSQVFCVSIRELLENEGSAPLKRLGSEGGECLGPTFETPNGTIWGLTAIVLRPILHKILKPVFLPHFNK